MLTQFIYLSVLFSLSAAHGLITEVHGGNGITGIGMGVDTSTPRTGMSASTRRDTSIIRDSEINSGRAGPCGRTNEWGVIDIVAELTDALEAGLPSLSPSAKPTLMMTLHQVDADGGGPYICDVSADGGKTFIRAYVETNVPGLSIGGISLPGAARDFPLNVEIPTAIKCSAGSNHDACIMRCRNNALAGPFGSCAVFTDVQNTQGARSVAPTSRKSTGLVRKSTQDFIPSEVVGEKRMFRSRVAGSLSGQLV